VVVVVGAATDLGRVRQNNEDNYAVFVVPHLPEGLDAVLVVADGMGGHQAGEVASGVVVEKFAGWFRTDTGPQKIDAGLDLSALLARIIQEANQEVFNASLQDAHLRGMGTTVIAAAIVRDRLYLGSVGDSRAYLIEGANIYQLNHDHSWVAEEVRAGRLSKDEAERHPRRNVLTRAVGVSSVVEVDTQTFELGAGDTLVLCTDGLTTMVSEPELLRIVHEYDDPNSAARRLIQLANDRGAPDNVTVVVACYRESAPCPRPDPATETMPAWPMARRYQ
jgi:serine/threonine protein phosphatase PrpC